MSFLGRLFSRGGMEHYRQGIFHFNDARYAEAATEFELALEEIRDPSNPYHALLGFYASDAHAKLGLSLLEQDRTADARRQFEAAFAEGYRYPDLHYLLARILEEQGELEAADAECRRALDIHQGYLEARALHAVVLHRLGRADEACEALRRLAGTPFLPERLNLDVPAHLDDALVSEIREETARRADAQSPLRQALAAYDRGDREGAIEALRQAVERHPGYADLRCKPGILYPETGALDLAEAELDEALRINPRYTEALLQSGIAALRRDAPEQAEERLARAAPIQPMYPDVLLFLAVARLRCGRLEEAREGIDEALRIHPRSHRARYVLALVLACQADAERGLEQMRAALEGDPNLHPRLVRALEVPARLDLDSDRAPEAETSLRCALEEKPDYPDLLYLLGKALDAQSRSEEAAAAYRRALEANPRFLEARISLGPDLVRAGNAGTGRGEFVRALRLDPSNPIARASADPALLDEL